MAKRQRRKGLQTNRIAASDDRRSNPSNEPTVDEVLAALRISNDELEAADRRRDELVGKARKVGASWTQIARALDMSQQGAHGRWRER